MRRYLWYPINACLRLVDRLYQRVKGLRPVGSLFYVEICTYQGPARELAGGLCLQPGQPLGVLHFNNASLQQAQRQSRPGGFVFARLILSTLGELAEAVQHDAELGRLVAFHGITWIPPHGQRIGFEVIPLPDTWPNRIRGWYFRLLLFAFNPRSSKRFRQRLRPYEFWLSRDSLLQQFGSAVVDRKHHV